MLDLGSNKPLEVKYNEQVYQIRKPSFKDISSYEKAIKGVGDTEQVNELFSFLEALGMPKNIAEGMPIEKIKLLSEHLIKGIDSVKK